MKTGSPAEKRLLTLAIVVFLSLRPAIAGSVRQANLETMVRLSASVLVGTCSSVQPSQILVQGQYLPVTRYSFRVTESLKGTIGAEFTFQQVGWPHNPVVSTQDPYNRVPLAIDGMPEYEVGEEYLLLLTRPGHSGLSSPVGLGQSAFRAYTDRAGNKVWMNGMANRGLFEGMRSDRLSVPESTLSTKTSSALAGLAYREFIGLVRQLAAGSR